MRTKLFLLLFAVLPTVALGTQVPEDRGAMGLSQALKRLDVVAGVLHTGAHPDDENSSLLAWLSRGQGVRTAYLSATRGDGGQNILGTELFEALGVIRTEELLAARRFDRAQQFFTPNYEFGFSKTAEETFEKWGRENVIGDFVRVIRQFRPEIIVSRFTGTPRDGHGHHQVAGIVTQEAFKAAADPNRFPEYGPAWQAKKLYLTGQGNEGQGVIVNVGAFDSALGRSYHQIAMEGRSLHRSQSMGAAQDAGPRTVRLSVIDKSIAISDNAGLFDGTLYKLPDLAQLEPALRSDLVDLQSRVDTIRQKATIGAASGIVPDLAEAIRALQEIQAKATHEHVKFLLTLKEPDFQEAARLAAGLVLDVTVSDDTLIPGQVFDLTIAVTNGGPYDFTTVKTNTEMAAGWRTEYVGSTGTLEPGERIEQRMRITVPEITTYTQPYWMAQPRQGDRFVWPAGSPVNMPFDPALLMTTAEVEFQGAALKFSKPAEFRRVDDIYGEQRSQLKIVPALSVGIAPRIAVVPLAGNRQKEFTVTVENQNSTPVESVVRLNVPEGWTVTPESRTVRFTRQGEKASAQFVVQIPYREGDFTVGATAATGGREFDSGYQVVTYPHMESRYLYSAAESQVEVFDVKTLATTVGYVEGAGDTVADAIKQLGVNVTMLSGADLASGDLSRFQTIVLGVRAYAVREDLRAYNNRLLEYVQNGGNLVVQYNTYEILDGQFGPYPFTINRPHDRVTKEEATVSILDPSHSVLNVPNKITESDFEGWVQERGLYFLGDRDPRYKPLLASNDPGEEPKDGGLVVARFGRGSYVYTGYGFFRQLPAGVKGAYRLFANLVSMEN